MHVGLPSTLYRAPRSFAKRPKLALWHGVRRCGSSVADIVSPHMPYCSRAPSCTPPTNKTKNKAMSGPPHAHGSTPAVAGGAQRGCRSVGPPRNRKQERGLQPPPAACRCAPRCAQRTPHRGHPRNRPDDPRRPAPTIKRVGSPPPQGSGSACRPPRSQHSGANTPRGPPRVCRGGSGQAVGSDLGRGPQSEKRGQQPTEPQPADRRGGRA